MVNPLNYSKSKCSKCDDYRNNYKTKHGNNSYGKQGIEVPQERKSTFKPQMVK